MLHHAADSDGLAAVSPSRAVRLAGVINPRTGRAARAPVQMDIG
jgi:hypothetical protein